MNSGKLIHGDTKEMRELASHICRDYLNGAWKNVTSQNIGFKHISGGLSNHLYHVSLPIDLHDIDNESEDEPTDVLVRIYGQTHGEDALETLITESVIFTLLSERGLGPKLHGIFPGGRLEEYINARALTTSELGNPDISRQIAEKMAALHTMELPLHKEPTWYWNTVGRWLRNCDRILNGEVPGFIKKLIDNGLNLAEEFEWLRQRLIEEESPVVFCHNDFQEGNILIKNHPDKENNPQQPELIVIDYEYCSYNYRAFDIANHFQEWVYNYTEPTYPFYKEDQNNYPTEKQRLHFIRHYLDARGSTEHPNKVLREVEVFTLASHFLWGTWAFVNADTSQIPFGYWEYGHCRLSNYMSLKKQLMAIRNGKLNV